MSLSPELAKLASQWLEWDMDPATKVQVQGWVDTKNERCGTHSKTLLLF
jgi:hypothetical protein